MRLGYALAVCVAPWLIATTLASAAPGELDPSFSGNGWVRTYDQTAYRGPYFSKGAESLEIQPDGKILAAGGIWTDGEEYFGVLRWTAGGDLDRGFGNAGWAAVDLGPFEKAHAVELQRDGKIVVAGEAVCNLSGCAAVVRFNPDGSLDRTFGGTGIVRTGGKIHGAKDVVIQPDGKIVAVGWEYHHGRWNDYTLFSVVRYERDGRLDRSFAGDGLAVVGLRTGQYPTAIGLQRDGRILVAGFGGTHASTTSDFVLMRLRRNGRLDRTFSRDGFQTVDFQRNDHPAAVAVQPDGRIVAAGGSGVVLRLMATKIALVRLNPNGTVDRRFGKRLTRPVPNGGSARSVLVQPDGRIVVAGTAYDDYEQSTSAWLLTRFHPNGRLDTSFGRRGVVIGDFGTGRDWAGAVARQPDGKIVVGGSVYEDQALARYRSR